MTFVCMFISNIIVICILYITYSTRCFEILTASTDKIKEIAMCVYV